MKNPNSSFSAHSAASHGVPSDGIQTQLKCLVFAVATEMEAILSAVDIANYLTASGYATTGRRVAEILEELEKEHCLRIDEATNKYTFDRGARAFMQENERTIAALINYFTVLGRQRAQKSQRTHQP